MKKNIFYLFPILFLFLVTSCDKEDEEPMPEPMTIVETAQATADLSLLVEAVVAADLVDALNSGTFTVLAPNNAAFQALLDSDPTWTTIADIPVDDLTSVLLYHVVAGEVRAADLLPGQVISMFGSGDVTVDLSNGAALQTGSGQTVNIILTDVQATNGVIHVVESVLLP